MTSGREHLLQRLRALPDEVSPDSAYVVEPFRPADAEGVARLYYTVYGDSYPIDDCYDPDAIRRLEAEGSLHAVVARLPGGAVVGYAALYASSPPFAGLFEYGQGMVHPAYRGSFILFHLFNATSALMQSLVAVEAVYGEAVCDAIITQHASSLYKFREVGLELDLLPGRNAGRISCLVMFRNFRDRRRVMHVAPSLAERVRWLAEYAGLDREIVSGGDCAGQTEITSRVFGFASVARLNVRRAGSDFAMRLGEMEAEALGRGCRVLQCYVNMADPGAANAATHLCERGYGLGGIAPRWFDDDALFLQRLLDPPNVAGIHLYSDRAREILAMALRNG
jgi:hypothetical protein